MDERNPIAIGEEKVAKTRKGKKVCDWKDWKSDYDSLACLDFDDCKGCGAFESEVDVI